MSSSKTSERRCGAFTKTGQCSRTGNAVLMNGYCHGHQYVAIEQMLKIIHDLDKRLANVATSDAVEELQSQLARARHSLRDLHSMCDQDVECKPEMELRRLIVAIDQVMLQADLPPPLERVLKQSQKGLLDNSLATSPEGARAEMIMLEQELSRSRKQQNDEAIVKLETDFQQEVSAATQREAEYKRTIDAIRQQLGQSMEMKNQAAAVLANLEQRLDQFQGEATQATGDLAQTIVQLRKDRDNYKKLFDEKVANEMRVSSKLTELGKTMQDSEKELTKLKARYENQFIELRKQFAERIIAGGQVLSDRELAMTDRIEVLTSALKEQQRLLEDAHAINKQIGSKDTNTARIARQMMQLTEELQTKQKEIAELQTRSSELRALVAEGEIRCEEQTGQAAAQMKEELNRLSDKNIRLQKDLTEKQEQSVAVQNQLYDLQRQHKMDMSAMETERQKLQGELANLRRKREQELLDLKSKEDLLKQRLNHENTQLRLTYDRQKDQLEQQFRDRTRELELGLERTKIQMQEEKRSLDLARKQVAETDRIHRQQKDAFDRTRAAFEAEQQGFLRQRGELESQKIRAEASVKQYSQMEDDYKNRIRTMNQRLELERSQHESKLKHREEQLAALQARNNDITASLEKCSVARQDLINRSNTLVEDQTKLKDQHAQLKLRLDSTKNEYELTLNRLRIDASAMQSNLNICSSKLQEVSAAHDDAKRMAEETRALKNQLNQTLRTAKGNEAAMKKLMQEHQMSKTEILKLQGAFSEARNQKDALQHTLDQTLEELQNVKVMESRLSSEMNRVAKEAERLRLHQEANNERERSSMKQQEDILKEQLVDTQRRYKQAQMQIMALQSQKSMAQNMLAETELDRAKQIDALVAAQQLQDQITFGDTRILPAITGKSSLLTT